MLRKSEVRLVNARVNTWLGALFLGSWALGASLLVWNVAHGEDPLTKAFVKAQLYQSGAVLDNL